MAQLSKAFALIAAVFFRAVSAAAHDTYPNTTACRYLPGDLGWPSTEQWNALNASVSGRLIPTVILGAVCHDPTYDAEACAALQQEWTFPQAHFNHPSSFASAYHENYSCNPFSPESQPCLLGNTVSYAINVTGAEDAKAGLKFAQEKNVRLVIKNTGHDYLGKSTGKGALSLWTHNLKSIETLNYSSAAYTGPAVKMGAGVQAFEAYAAVAAKGLKVVGGECVTVGLAGGFTQGGGHSLLSSKHGLGADQTLEWEVVTADGTHLIASPTTNADLYWALSGGGGGTYAVVLSLTVKAYPDGIVGGAAMAVPVTSIDSDALWDLVTFFQATILPSIVDAGAHVQWGVFGPLFVISEITIPDADEAFMRSTLKPLTSYLDERNLTYQLNVTAFPNYYDHMNKYIGPFPYGVFPASQIQGGLMISRSTVLHNVTEITAVLRRIITTTGFYIAPYSLNVGRAPSSPNAVLPAWREALTYYTVIQTWNFSQPFEYMDEQEKLLTEELMPPLQEFASGAYLSESDFHNPRWREEFYGENWDELHTVKSRWDPESLFYATTAIGSDAWRVNGDGRLCRA